MRGKGRRELLDERAIHVLVVVRYIKADDSLVAHDIREHLAQTVVMPTFHYEDDVSPSNVVARYANTGTAFRPTRANAMGAAVS